jgi:hypothetical protein
LVFNAFNVVVAVEDSAKEDLSSVFSLSGQAWVFELSRQCVDSAGGSVVLEVKVDSVVLLLQNVSTTKV